MHWIKKNDIFDRMVLLLFAVRKQFLQFHNSFFISRLVEYDVLCMYFIYV